MAIFLYGLINSAIFALMAIGFSLIYGISGIANFAHGALYVLTAFLTWTFLNNLGINYIAAAFLSLIIAAVIGALIYRFLLIRVRGSIAVEVIVTFACGLMIMELLHWAGFIEFSYSLPVFIKGTVNIANVPVDLQRLIILFAAGVLLVFLWFFTHHTRIGLAFRGMAQDERAALMLGIDSDRMALVSLAFGSAMAGFAALIILPTGGITIEGGYNALIYAVGICILGGLGHWVGTVLGAIVLGYAGTIVSYLISPLYGIVIILVAIIVTLIVKPSGIWGKSKELEERV